MNIWDDPKFSRPTDAVGDWHFARSACFAQAEAPTAVKYAVEKMTGQLLQREPVDAAAPVLRYAGTSGAGGHPCTVQLELVAVENGDGQGEGGAQHLYRFGNASNAPRRWEEERRFTAACERRFAHWCGQLPIVADPQTWPGAPHARLLQCVLDTVAAEDAAARAVEDPAPVLALQREVLAALRAGMGFFTASKEGGSHLFFDGSVFRRNDDGEAREASTVYADDAAMVEALRRFYDWDARQGSHPHPKPELQVWQYIQSQLRPR